MISVPTHPGPAVSFIELAERRLDFVLLIFLSHIFLSVSFLPRGAGKAPTEKCRTEK